MISTLETSYSSDDAETWSADSSDDNTTQGVVLELAYQVIWNHFCGFFPEEDHPTFNLGSQRAYRKLYSMLAKHKGLFAHFKDEIRKDWDAGTGILTLRLMDTMLHDQCQERFLETLKKEMNHLLTTYPSLRPFRDNLIFGRHARICYKKKQSRVPSFHASPDGQLSYGGKRSFILEVEHGESDESISQKVDGYYWNAPSPEYTLLVINLQDALPATSASQHYHHQGSVSMWSPTVDRNKDYTVRCFIKNRIFRDRDGQAMPGELLIPFELLLPPNERRKIPLDARSATIRFSFESLSELVRQSEEMEQSMEEETNAAEKRPPARKVTMMDEDGSIMWEREGPNLAPRPE
ncbi:hypothetical protein F5Y10DRAFT_270006 [Nemania abortiva]|nr:hypothetical protein F5Y10DRAFT_270006 [Nemania abortiva]